MAHAKVFISYSRVDGMGFASQLTADLEQEGYNVWIDREDIRAGVEWDAEIEKALENCDVVLFLVTDRSVASTHVLDEVYYALEQRKRIIPLIFDDTRLPFRLNRIQHLDFSKDYTTAFRQLKSELEGPGNLIESGLKPTRSEKPSFLVRHRVLIISLVLVSLILGSIIITGRSCGKFRQSQSSRSKAVHANRQNAERDSIHLFALAIGEWQLDHVDQTTKGQRGYLRVQPSASSGVDIKSHLHFYYPDTSAAQFLSVFEAFVGCRSCVLSNDMSLRIEDISISYQSIERAKVDQADGTKAGAVIRDGGYTKSIQGSASLLFPDTQTAVIIVKRKQPVILLPELKLPPFDYRFYFKKRNL